MSTLESTYTEYSYGVLKEIAVALYNGDIPEKDLSNLLHSPVMRYIFSCCLYHSMNYLRKHGNASPTVEVACDLIYYLKSLNGLTAFHRNNYPKR